jgi:Coenzyme PQQ synthesis protein D (PqqD)
MTAKLSSQVVLVDTEDGAVLFDQRRGTYWQLNAAGAFVVERLLNGTGAEELAVAMTRRYPVEPERALADVQALLAGMLKAGLITATDGEG